MLTNLKKFGWARALQFQLAASYIHLENHNIKINSQRKLFSYDDPKVIHCYDKQPDFSIKLSKVIQRQIQQTQFEMFRDRLILVKEKVQQQKEPDPIWDLEQPPKHYNTLLPITAFYTIAPFNNQYPPESQVHPLFKVNDQLLNQIDQENLSKYSINHLVWVALRAREQKIADGKFWYQLQTLIHNKYNNLTTSQLVQIKRSFAIKQRFGTPKFHKILNDLIKSELNLLNPQELLATFCAFKNQGNTCHQDQILKLLLNSNTIKSFQNPQQSLNFFRFYVQDRVPLYYRKLQFRYIKERETQIHKIVSILQLQKFVENYSLEQTLELHRLLFKSKMKNIDHILLIINTTLINNINKLSLKQLFTSLFTMTKVKGGQGLISLQFYNLAKPILLNGWANFNDYQKLKILYCYWNICDWNQQLKNKYAQIKVQSQPNLLYYFTQIEYLDSSGREKEILRGLTSLKVFPLPYYYKYKQFFAQFFSKNKGRYLPYLSDKISQVELHYSVTRHTENYLRNPDIIELGKFLATIEGVTFDAVVELENLELIQFCIKDTRIGIEIIKQSDFVPGTKKLKKSFLARKKTIQLLSWTCISIHWEQFKLKPRQQQYKIIESAIKAAHKKQSINEIKLQKEGRDQINQTFISKVSTEWDTKTREEMYNLLEHYKAYELKKLEQRRQSGNFDPPTLQDQKIWTKQIIKATNKRTRKDIMAEKEMKELMQKLQ